MIIVIPSYEPSHRLVDLVDSLAGNTILVVDDGSGRDFAPIFSQVVDRGAVVIRHPENRGKGAALRTAFAAVQEMWPGHGVVCADSDGQHTPYDIARVGAKLAEISSDHDQAMVLGVRRFTGPVPLRSRMGNQATAWLFARITGVEITDTQTGLRGYPAATLDWLLSIDGDRFEYEQKLLLEGASTGLRIFEVDIETIYLEHNASSHFRPIQDSWRVWKPMLTYRLHHRPAQPGVQAAPIKPEGEVAVRFGLSSFAGFGIDLLMFTLALSAGIPVVAAIVIARLISGTANFSINRHWVFRTRPKPDLVPALIRYVGLAAVLVGANAVLVPALMWLGMPAVWAKVLCEGLLFVTSFLVQRSSRLLPSGRAGATPQPGSPESQQAKAQHLAAQRQRAVVAAALRG